MQYCALIVLSSTEISFLYNQSEGENMDRLVPFYGKESIPLAIYCSDNCIEISAKALEQARKGIPGYYNNVMEVFKKPGSFRYLGREYGYRDMLKLAIENRLPDLFTDILFDPNGLESHRSTMPLGFVFDSTVPDNVCNYIVESFRSAGYNNVGRFSLNKFFVNQVTQQFGPNRDVIILTSDGTDVLVHLLSKGASAVSETRVFPGMAEDPRVKMLVDVLIPDMMENAYIGGGNFDDIRDKASLEAYITRILKEGRSSIINEPFKLVDGTQIYIRLDARVMSNISRGGNQNNLKNQLYLFIENNHVNLQNVVVLLAGNVKNDYFSQSLKDDFQIQKVDRDLIYKLIVEDVKRMNYTFSTPKSNSTRNQQTAIQDQKVAFPNPLGGFQGQQSDFINTTHVNSAPIGQWGNSPIQQDVCPNENAFPNQQGGFHGHQSDFIPPINDNLLETNSVGRMNTSGDSSINNHITTPQQPPKELIRKAKLLLRSYQNRADLQNVKDELEAIFKELENYDDKTLGGELKLALEQVDKKLNKPKPDASKFKREVSVLTRTVPHLNPSEAKKKIDDLLSRMHAEGVHDFDSELTKILPKETTSSTTTSNTVRQTPPTRLNSSGAYNPVKPEVTQVLSPVEQKKLGREIKMALHKSGITKTELQNLLNKAHQAGIHDYDTDLKAAIGRAK